MNALRANLNHMRGVSLIEVLVAVVVLSIGLLGIAGLQIAGIRYTYDANLRYQAAMQASDMTDRIRANRQGMIAGNYNGISGPGSDPGCISTSCSVAQMAQTDQFQWNASNAALLPGGAGTVVGDGTNFTVTITWNEMTATGPAAQTYSVVVRLQ